MFRPYLVATRVAATTNITTSYSELVPAASNTEECHQIIFASAGNVNLIVGVGESGSEEDLFILAAGTNTGVPERVLIPKGQRISIKTLNATVASGTYAWTFCT